VLAQVDPRRPARRDRADAALAASVVRVV